MTIDNLSVVDIVGTEAESNSVHLTVADHLEWGGEHLLLLQEKLNVYLAFVESGEIYSVYPDAIGRNVVIDVVCKFRPTPDAMEFLARAANVVVGSGIKLRYGPTDGGYDGDAA